MRNDFKTIENKGKDRDIEVIFKNGRWSAQRLDRILGMDKNILAPEEDVYQGCEEGSKFVTIPYSYHSGSVSSFFWSLYERVDEHKVLRLYRPIATHVRLEKVIPYLENYSHRQWEKENGHHPPANDNKGNSYLFLGL
jgi:hypothetical protein